jgi:hypothetical protein
MLYCVLLLLTNLFLHDEGRNYYIIGDKMQYEVFGWSSLTISLMLWEAKYGHYLVPIFLALAWLIITYLIIRRGMLKNGIQDWKSIRISVLVGLVPMLFLVSYWYAIFLTFLGTPYNPTLTVADFDSFHLYVIVVNGLIILLGIVLFAILLWYKDKFSFSMLGIFIRAIIIGLLCGTGLAYIYFTGMESLKQRDPAYIKFKEFDREISKTDDPLERKEIAKRYKYR